MYTVESFPARELGNSSFLVADVDRGVAAVIDPLRDVDAYLSRAEALGVKVTNALDTHLHNDFVSGRRELQAEAGTDIAELSPAQELTVGELTLQALHTPGHTPDHLSYLLFEAGRPREALRDLEAAVVLGMSTESGSGETLADAIQRCEEVIEEMRPC